MSGFSALEAAHMRAALMMGRRGRGRTGENPPVGCVIARGARIVGRGRTADGGRPHAETQALEMARAHYGAGALTGAAAYVTLEPCAHTGQTPPCARALIEAGIARVIYAHEDPDPRVNGAGGAMLEAAGIITAAGLLREEAARDLAGFLRRIRGAPAYLTLKLASSLDGRIALSNGESRWISGPEARRMVHHLRAQSDAVLIGSGTALADDPMLDVRLDGLASRQPARAVADSHLRAPLTGRLAQSARAQSLFLLARNDASPERIRAFEEIGAHIIATPMDAEGRLDLRAALISLCARGMGRVLCEGGGALASSLIRADLVDELIWVQAGLAIGAEGAGAIGAMGLEHLASAPRFGPVETRQVGADIVTHWRRRDCNE